jgi:hypothetical protein
MDDRTPRGRVSDDRYRLRLARPIVLGFLVAPLVAAPAAALSLTLAGPTSGALSTGVGVEAAAPSTQLGFTVGLDAATSINGYDVTIAWDPTELALASATPVAGLAFGPAPNPGQSAGTRVASLSLPGVLTATLFSLSFDVLATTQDGLADVRVFVDAGANGSGIAPGSLALANPTGAGIDVIPEPSSQALLGFGLVGLAAARRAVRRREARRGVQS